MPFSGEAQQLRDGLWGLDVSELICSFPNCPLSHHSGAGHQDEVWPAPRPSVHLPSCRDEASSISSPATLCKEEQHRLLLRAGGLCCASLLLWLSPKSCARGQGLISQGEQGATHQRCGTTGWDGGVLEAMGAGSPARPSCQPCPKHCWARPGGWGKVSSATAPAKWLSNAPKEVLGAQGASLWSPTGKSRQPRLLALGYSC